MLIKWIIQGLIQGAICGTVCAAGMLGLWFWYERKDRKWFEEQEVGGYTWHYGK